MTTTAQVKEALIPLLARHSDLVLIGRFLIVKPLHHILRGVFVDRSSDKRSFEPHIVTYPLVPAQKDIMLGWNPVMALRPICGHVGCNQTRYRYGHEEPY